MVLVLGSTLGFRLLPLTCSLASTTSCILSASYFAKEQVAYVESLNITTSQASHLIDFLLYPCLNHSRLKSIAIYVRRYCKYMNTVCNSELPQFILGKYILLTPKSNKPSRFSHNSLTAYNTRLIYSITKLKHSIFSFSKSDTYSPIIRLFKFYLEEQSQSLVSPLNNRSGICHFLKFKIVLLIISLMLGILNTQNR